MIQPTDSAAYYERHYNAMIDASKKRKSVNQSLGEASETRRTDGAAAILASKAAKKSKNSSPSSSIAGNITPNSSSTIDTVDLTSDALAPFKRVKGSLQTFLTPSSTSKEAVANMDYALGAFIIEGGLPFRLIEDRNLVNIIKLSKTVPFAYKPPTRKRLTDELLPLIHKQRQTANLALLEKDKDIFGIQLYGDGATIKHKPLFNFLAAGGHVSNFILEIRDCSPQMASGGKKSAEYLAGIMEEHLKTLDPTGECCDFVLMDGAANVQKAGRILAARHPRITSIHSSEHGITLFFTDVAGTAFGKVWVRFYSFVYNWFGGAHHKCHALFMAHSRKCNEGRPVGLMKPTETRMAGFWICYTRLLRLEAVFDSLLGDPFFKNLPAGEKPPETLIKILRKKEFWGFLYLFLRAMYPALRLLRMADLKLAAMDKLYFGVIKTDLALHDECCELNKWSEDFYKTLEEDMTFLVFKSRSSGTQGICGADDEVDKAGEEAEALSKEAPYDTEEDSDDDGTMESLPEEMTGGDGWKLGVQLTGLWKKRRHKLVHDFSLMACVLSPVPEIRNWVDEHLDLKMKLACERLIVKLLMPLNLTDEEATAWKAHKINKFWDEYEDFSNKTGTVFGPAHAHIWASNDIKENRSHMWHKKYSLKDTEVLGPLACRGCSKLTGMGNAERNWAAVKHLKDGKRSHLSPAMVTMQATVYGAACAERVALENKFREHQCVTSWEDKDLERLGLPYLDVQALRQATVPVRLYNCWTEDWETECIHTSQRNSVNAARLLSKYGGLRFGDGDKVKDPDYCELTIHDSKLYHHKRRGHSMYMLIGCHDGYESDGIEHKTEEADDTRFFEIDDDFHGLVYEWYRKNPDPKVRVVAPPDALSEDGEWNNWIPEPTSKGQRKSSKSRK